ncbi:hypothetical protein [Draconibacterium sp.]|uniref:hypothetical protein n=1 Tax=Draconibacterium sp. TaxID=1965318 RepID=UPI003569DAA1
MATKTFVLSNPRVWKREVAVWLLNKDKKLSKRLLPFATENVKPGQRREKGRAVPAQFTTADEKLQEALYRNTGYGKDFYEKGDKEGKNKMDTLVVSKEDAELVALRSLYEANGLVFDENDPLDVAKKKYEIHIHALAGTRKLGESTATEIAHVEVDPKKQISDAIAAGKKAYEEKYGEPVPEAIAGDKAKLITLIDGMNTPEFDVEAYVAEATKEDDEESSEDVKAPEASSEEKKEAKEPTKDDLLKEYFDKFGKNVPNTKKNDLSWIKEQLAKPE